MSLWLPPRRRYRTHSFNTLIFLALVEFLYVSFDARPHVATTVSVVVVVAVVARNIVVRLCNVGSGMQCINIGDQL